jgi:hypothetical protein
VIAFSPLPNGENACLFEDWCFGDRLMEICVTEPVITRLASGRSRLTRDILDTETIGWTDVRPNCAIFVLTELKFLGFQPSSVVRGCVELNTRIVSIEAGGVEGECVTFP